MVTNRAKIKLLVLLYAFVRTNYERMWRKRSVFKFVFRLILCNNFTERFVPFFSHTFINHFHAGTTGIPAYSTLVFDVSLIDFTTDDGDLQLEGEITGYDTRAAALSSADEVSMNRPTITIKVRLTNTVDPDASFEQSFSRYRDYAASRDFSSVESSLVSEIVTELCEDVFNKSVVNW